MPPGDLDAGGRFKLRDHSDDLLLVGREGGSLALYLVEGAVYGAEMNSTTRESL